jgi:lysophospholipase L1-like esterase
MPIAAGIRKGVLLKLLAAAFLCFFLFPQLVFAASVRIMPLGDSITNGSSSGVVPDSPQYYLSYRKALRDKLTDRGYQIDYVGSQVSGNAIFSDAQHEGHGGWVADGGPADVSIRPNVYNFLVANPADIVLLHIGTNDVDAGHAYASDLASILDEIDRYSPNVWVVLALIINRATPPCALCTTTTAYNDALDAMVRTRLNDKIVVVDMETGAGLDYRLYPSGDMYDTLHPFARGYEKMAEAWLQGLREILPTADAGTDQNVNPGDTVTLNGSGSTDALGTIVAYAWVQTGGSPTVTLTNANTVQARFTAPDTSTGSALIFRLSITDDKGFSHSGSCVVNVNGRPVADAGPDQQVNPGVSVVLDGSNSNDADGSIIAYQWLQTAGTPIVALANAGTVRASFTAPSVGAGGTVLTFKLTVTDDRGSTKSDTCVVNVNGPPVADAGPDQQVQSGANVTLDGSGSTDGENGALAYAWVQTSGPAVSLSNPSSVRPSFLAPTAGAAGATLTFRLTVTDSSGLQSGDSCTVTVSPQQGAASGSSGGGGGGGCFITAAGQ